MQALLRAPRKITVGLPSLASEVSDGKGFHSGKRGEAGFFEVSLMGTSKNHFWRAAAGQRDQ
jgi:hypothetical protein